MPSRTLAADLEAAETLKRANGVCFLCERPSGALIAVERGGDPQAVCLDERRCSRRIRAQLNAEDGGTR